MSTHTPKTSATMAAPTFKGSAILLIVTDFCVYSIDHDSAAALVIIFETSILSLSMLLAYVFPVEINFPSPLCAHVGPVVCFLIMFPVDVFHEVIDVRDRFGSSSLPP